jgi:hypothetical protein
MLISGLFSANWLCEEKPQKKNDVKYFKIGLDLIALILFNLWPNQLTKN